jgi:hypothetical protein
VISNQLLVMCDQLSAFSKSRGGIKSSNPPEAEERRFGIKSSNHQIIKSSNQHYLRGLFGEGEYAEGEYYGGEVVICDL